MTLEQRKQQLINQLDDVERDCKTLLGRTAKFYIDLLAVRTEEEAKEFDRTHDLEDGLRIITFK